MFPTSSDTRSRHLSDPADLESIVLIAAWTPPDLWVARFTTPNVPFPRG